LESWERALPADWEVKPLRRVLLGGLASGVFKKRDEFGDGALLVNVGDLYRPDFRLSAESLERVAVTEEEYMRFKVESGDIFFVRSSLKEEGVAVSAIAVDVPEPMVFECHVVRARPNPHQVLPRFLSLWLNSSICRQWLRSRANTTTMTTIDQGGLLSVRVPVPPLHEQQAIVDQIEAIFLSTAELTDIARRMQDRLREYRSSLVSAVVAGQINVENYN
jgi:type I restriction enzyme S subunit